MPTDNILKPFVPSNCVAQYGLVTEIFSACLITLLSLNFFSLNYVHVLFLNENNSYIKNAFTAVRPWI
jgi:hypothetical protein